MRELTVETTTDEDWSPGGTDAVQLQCTVHIVQTYSSAMNKKVRRN